jgi:hypothetical protein
MVPSINPPTLDYARPRREPLTLWRVFVWLTPLWTAGIIGLHWVFGGGDDAYWWAAILFAALVGVGCVHSHRPRLALYCFAIVVGILLISIVLPSINRAR